LSKKELSSFLKNIKTAESNPTIIIKADKESTASSIVNVMGLSIENGLYKIAIATKK
jgi:biopolymer transport protein ExbD